MGRKFLLFVVLGIILMNISPSCKIGYSFTGANLSPEVKTFSVYYFPNRARLINPTLSQTFTEQLREKLQRQTSLNELAENGDIEFEGQISDYNFRPMAIQKEDLSAQTRLTVSIKLKYTNHKEPESDFEQTFTAFEDFDSNQSVSDVEEGLVLEIVKKLTEDIFNATIANW